MNRSSVRCPVSQEKTNENIARTVAFLVIVIAGVGIYYKLPFLFAALAFDFYLRTFTTGKYSPLKYIAKKYSSYLRIPRKMTDAAPKKFAASIGILFSVSIAILLWLHYYASADLLAAILLICAGLESFLGFCLGCIIYTYIVLPFLSKENSEQSTISINL